MTPLLEMATVGMDTADLILSTRLGSRLCPRFTILGIRLRELGISLLDTRFRLQALLEAELGRVCRKCLLIRILARDPCQGTTCRRIP